MIALIGFYLPNGYLSFYHFIVFRAQFLRDLVYLFSLGLGRAQGLADRLDRGWLREEIT